MDTDTIIANCVARVIPDPVLYSIQNLGTIGEVVMREDGYYGLAVCSVMTPEDNGTYKEKHVKFMPFAPLILFLIQSVAIELNSLSRVTTLFNELLVYFSIPDTSIWYNDNAGYIINLDLVWMYNIHDCMNQLPDPTDTNLMFRSNYEYFMSCTIQSTLPCDEC